MQNINLRVKENKSNQTQFVYQQRCNERKEEKEKENATHVIFFTYFFPCGFHGPTQATLVRKFFFKRMYL